MSVPCPNPKCVISSDKVYFFDYVFFNPESSNKNIATITTESDREDWGIHDSVELNICDRCGYRLGDPQPWQKNIRIKGFIVWILIILFFSWATIYSLLEDSGYFWVSLFFLFISLIIFRSNEIYKLSDDDE
tara:strand:- start:141 stop:536 length:396 start_codon:yes stop_codon:yes gene_type:complete